eukprot:UN07254
MNDVYSSRKEKLSTFKMRWILSELQCFKYRRNSGCNYISLLKCFKTI